MHASVDDIQNYADDTRTTCRRHVTRGFCPKMGKKSLTTPKLLKKSFRRRLRKPKTFFLSYKIWYEKKIALPTLDPQTDSYRL